MRLPRSDPRRARPPRRRASTRGAPGCARPASSSRRASSNSAVEASRRSLMFDECAERISTAPISSQAARSAPVMTCSSIGSGPARRHAASVARGAQTHGAPLVDAARPARGDEQGRLGQGPHGRPLHLPADAVIARRLAPAAAAPAPQTDTRIVTSSTSPAVVAIAVAPLVRAGEHLAQARAGRWVRLDRQLERLSAVAQLVGRCGRPSARVRARRIGVQKVDARADRASASSSSRRARSTSCA